MFQSTRELAEEHKVGDRAQDYPSLRVLIVDDEPLIRWSMAETFLELGHVVTEASDGASALRALEDHAQFDAVLLDYRLPDSNDLNLLASVRKRTPKSAVIMTTAFGTPAMFRSALELGAHKVVPKPFDVHEIARWVVDACVGR